MDIVWFLVYPSAMGVALFIAWKSESACLQKTAGVLFITWVTSNMIWNDNNNAFVSVYMVLDLLASVWCMYIWYMHFPGTRPVAILRVIILFGCMISIHFIEPILLPRIYDLILNLLFLSQLFVIIFAGLLLWGEVKNNKLAINYSHPMLFDGDDSLWQLWKSV